MVSFTCEYCQDVVKKPKVISHANSCGGRSFTCVDCMQVFDLDSIRGHTTCLTETEKYQGQWRQKKLTQQRSSQPGAERPPPMRPPRPAMDDLTDSSSDEDWVQKRPAKRARDGHGAPNKAALKKLRGVDATSSDDDGEDLEPAAAVRSHTPPAHAAEKKARRARSPASATALSRRQTPLLLPRSTASEDCTVPSFVLGSSTEVREITEDILREEGVGEMEVKEVARRLVERYQARIAKAVRHAVTAAVELGSLKQDVKGNISCV